MPEQPLSSHSSSARDTCPTCGKPWDREHIAPHVQALADSAGLPAPNWYAGQFVCPRDRTWDEKLGEHWPWRHHA